MLQQLYPRENAHGIYWIGDLVDPWGRKHPLSCQESNPGLGSWKTKTQDRNKMDLNKRKGVRAWNGLNWLRVKINGGLL
jgi:hypothetical protein